MGTVVPFAKSVFICALGMFLQETLLNSAYPLEAFDIVINSLPNSIVAGKSAEFSTEGGINMIKYLKGYLTVTAKNEKRGIAKVPSEWVN